MATQIGTRVDLIQDALHEARSQGYDAYLAGKYRWDNPYHNPSCAYLCWNRGWINAWREDRDRKEQANG